MANHRYPNTYQHPIPQSISDQVISAIHYWGHEFWETAGDARLSKLPLLNGGPWHVLSLTMLYLYFVKVSGPRMMKDRPPYELRGVMLFHNFILILINGIGFFTAIFGTKLSTLLECKPFDPSSPLIHDQIMLYLGYTYYVSKFIDFLDTVYFVLRKKQSHITGLHVFHHTMMPISCYVFFKFSSYTNNGFIPLINSMVHFLMYTYYALASMGPRYQKYLWVKKYITQIQLIQFVFASIHSVYFLLDRTCDCSKFLSLFQASHSILFLYLFSSFYLRTYTQPKSKKVA